MSDFQIATTEEEKLRCELGQLRFLSGHMQLVLQMFKEQYEAGEVDQEQIYLRANTLLELAEGRTSEEQ